MIVYIYILLNFILILFLNNSFKKKNFLISETGDFHQKFASKQKIPLTGGIFFFISSLYFFNFELISFYIFAISIFSLGIFSDLKYLKSAKLRLFLQGFLVFFFIFILDIKINDTRIYILDHFLQNSFLNYLFVSFCVLILINGSNFFDGLNTLNIGYFILITLCIFYLNINNEIILYDFPLEYVFYSLLIMLLLNFFNQIYLGDSGSYLLGLFFSIFLIFIYKWNPNISPFFIILLLWYPSFENLFSILRKNILKKSPMRPDSNHLHQLIFYFIKKKMSRGNILHANIISACLINSYNLLIFLLSLKFISNSQVQIILIIFNVIVYFFIYLKLFILRYKKI